jgi:hypothetical protein
MNKTAARWVRGLPIRWGLGGLVVGFVWSLVSSAAQGSFAHPVGGLVAGLVRTFAWVVLPLGFLGFLWGWSERLRLEHVSSEGIGQLEVSIRRSVSRQTLKAMTCGAIFGLFIYGLGHFPSFQSWDSVANIKNNIYKLLGAAILAIPLGVIVGVLFKRNMLRRLPEISRRQG